jgi:hypothetical protein
LEIMAEELGWDKSRVDEELKSISDRFDKAI